MIVSNKTQEALQHLIKYCFQCNRNADRWVSILAVELVCPIASKLLHHNVAHYFPAVADEIGEKTLERYNISVLYGETLPPIEPEHILSDIANKFMEMGLDFQSMLIATAKIANEENDVGVYADLLNILSNYNKILEQLILVKDKADSYTDTMSFDHDIKEFWFLGE